MGFPLMEYKGESPGKQQAEDQQDQAQAAHQKKRLCKSRQPVIPEGVHGVSTMFQRRDPDRRQVGDVPEFVVGNIQPDHKAVRRQQIDDEAEDQDSVHAGAFAQDQ